MTVESLECRRLLSWTPAIDNAPVVSSIVEDDHFDECACRAEAHATDTLGTTTEPVMVACPVPVAGLIQPASGVDRRVVPLSDTFTLHSRPYATKVIYLDFDGHTTSGTAWNSGGTLITPPYSIDNESAFSDKELGNIQEIWARVAEDFSPFDVDVTTTAPLVDDLRKSGAGDERWGIRVAIGGGFDDWLKQPAGGVAYIGSFTWSSDTPCFVFSRNTANGDPKSTAEAASHEVGHTLGLVHDGRTTPSEGYYAGHGSGVTGWAPIMGVGYSRELVQWSKGEYSDANNSEDDLSIITTQNGFGYRVDDRGGTIATASALPALGAPAAASGGVIERSDDVDVFQIVVTGPLKLKVSPAAISPNLDVLAEVWNAAGSVLFTSNPLDALDASFDLAVTPGTYYLAVRGTGKGDVKGTGYSNYASLGQYTVSVEEPTFSLAAADARKQEGNASSTPFSFVVTRSLKNGEATIDWTIRGAGANPASPDDFVGGAFPQGTVRFAPGETSKTIVVMVQGDPYGERNEGFAVSLANPSSGLIVGGLAEGSILNDDSTTPLVSITATDTLKPEGNSGTTSYGFTITRSGWVSDGATVTWSVVGSGNRPANQDDFVNRIYPTGQVVFAPNETMKTIAVAVVGDTIVEQDEGFTVNILSPGSVLGPTFANATIRDDDASPAFVVSTGDSRKAEGNSGTTGYTFIVTRLVMTATTAVVNWAVSGFGLKPATASDFADGKFPNGSVTFAPSETSKTVTVNVAGDTTIEADEGFAVTISTSTPNSRVIIATAYGTIVNDDVLPLLSVVATDARKTEGNSGTTAFRFTVYRSRYTAIQTDVPWSVSGSSTAPATADDFVSNLFPSGIIRFAVGDTTKVITVSVKGDTVFEADERFTVTIGGPLGTISSGAAIGTIVNDDTRALIAAAAFALSPNGEASTGKPRPRPL